MAAARSRARVCAIASAIPRPRVPFEKETHVKSKTKRQPHPRLYKIYRPTPAQIAAIQKVARIHRQEWRDRVAANAAAAANGGEAAAHRRNRDEAAQRAAFASAIARAELGRHYWDERKLARPKHPTSRRRTNVKAPT
jgi:hypothetical protein